MIEVVIHSPTSITEASMKDPKPSSLRRKSVANMAKAAAKAVLQRKMEAPFRIGPLSNVLVKSISSQTA